MDKKKVVEHLERDIEEFYRMIKEDRKFLKKLKKEVV